MPSQTNSIGNLEVLGGSADDTFRLSLNDKMRQIQNALLAANGTGTSASGGSGGVSQLILTVPGILAVESDCAAAVTLPVLKRFTGLIVLLKKLPIGGPVIVQLFANGVAWGPAVTATGLKTTTDVSGFPAIAKDALIRLDITAVGATLSGVSFPGADLTVELR